MMVSLNKQISTETESKITSDADCKSEVETRLAIGIAAVVKLTNMWEKAISNNTKLRLLKALVWPQQRMVVKHEH